jgi:excisionase family DNA binding protein
MAQVRTKSKKPSQSVPKANVNGLVAPLVEVLTLPEAAAYLRVAETDVLQLMQNQELPGRQFGREFRFLKSALQDWLRTPPASGSREAALSAAGAWKDDPYVLQELEEIYRKRREDPIGGDE